MGIYAHLQTDTALPFHKVEFPLYKQVDKLHFDNTHPTSMSQASTYRIIKICLLKTCAWLIQIHFNVFPFSGSEYMLAKYRLSTE